MAQHPRPEPIKYADLFEKEAGQHIAGLRAVLAGLGACDSGDEIADLVRRLRNHAHGLSGVASAVGVEPISRLMGAVEEAAVAVIRAGVVPPAALVRAAAEATEAADAIGQSVLGGDDPPESLDIEGLIAAVRTGADAT